MYVSDMSRRYVFHRLGNRFSVDTGGQPRVSGGNWIGWGGKTAASALAGSRHRHRHVLHLPSWHELCAHVDHVTQCLGHVRNRLGSASLARQTSPEDLWAYPSPRIFFQPIWVAKKAGRRTMDTSARSSFTLATAPVHPNAVCWSEENLVAVAAGHLVVITVMGVAAITNYDVIIMMICNSSTGDL